jgi:demethylmenaquinone methyltransferase / 2-methoxy-6-polyprenyl-1,4-benzoquinol methylase
MGSAEQKKTIPEESPLGWQGEGAFFGYRRIPAKEKARFVQRHFDSIASQYDFMNTLLSVGFHYLWKRAAIRALELRPGDRVIDVCGGTADLAIHAAKKVGPGGRVVLYDFNRAMIKAGKPKVVKAGVVDRIRDIQGDAERISVAAGGFDAAVVGFGIRNLTHMEQGLAEMFRVLKPGGKIMCLEFSIPPSRLFRWPYDIYSFHVMPRLGKIFTGSREAYIYLPESIRKFPLADELSAILREIGFIDVTYRRLTFGIAVIHIGKKSS